MINVGFGYQLANDRERTKEFIYRRNIPNCDMLEIFEGLQEGCTFEDLVYSVDSLCEVYNEIQLA